MFCFAKQCLYLACVGGRPYSLDTMLRGIRISDTVIASASSQ